MINCGIKSFNTKKSGKKRKQMQIFSKLSTKIGYDIIYYFSYRYEFIGQSYSMLVNQLFGKIDL